MKNARYVPVPRILQIGAPVAGANFSVRPNTGAGWLFRTLRLTFATDANAATRELSVAVTDGSSEWIRVGAQTNQTAGQQREYCGFEGCVLGASTLAIRGIDWPDSGIYVPQGHTMSSVISNIQVGDQLSAIAASIIEFPTGAPLTLWPFPSYFTSESD